MRGKFLLFLMSVMCLFAGCSDKTKFKSVDSKEFERQIAVDGVQLVDVRTADEFASKHIVGAVNIDVTASDFDEKVAKLDKTKPIAVYCRSGNRSKRAAQRMASAGFVVVELDGGILSWSGAVE